MQLHHDKHHRAYVDGRQRGARRARRRARQERLLARSPRWSARSRSTCRGTCCTRCSGRTWRRRRAASRPARSAEQMTRDFGEFARFRGELTSAAMTIMGSGWAALIVGSAEQAAADRADPRSPERDHAGRRPDPGARRLGARLLPAIRPREEDATSRRSGTSGTGPTPAAASRRFAGIDLALPPARPDRATAQFSSKNRAKPSLRGRIALACAPHPFDKERRRCRI